MNEIIGIFFVLAFVVIAGGAAVAVFWGLLRGIKAGGALPYRPIPVIWPPVPIVAGKSVTIVGLLAVGWSLAHLAVASGWSVTGYLMPRVAAAWLAAAYVAFAALLVGTGGVLMLAKRPFGRRLIAWGTMLLGLLTFYALIISLLLPKYDQAPLWVRRLSRVIAAISAAHIIFNTAVGALAQRVGRPPGWSDQAEEPGAFRPDLAEEEAAVMPSEPTGEV